jgi:hypothetical protein
MLFALPLRCKIIACAHQWIEGNRTSAARRSLEKQPATVSQFTIEQVVTTAGDGSLRDESLSSRELREYLLTVLSEKLFEYIDGCLTRGFNKSGLVLQDLINELGRRLDYRVENGFYQGRSNAVGFDGIWHAPDGHALVLEVKTTDAYSINLDTIAAIATH